METTKACTKCHLEIPLSGFYRINHADRAPRLQSWCKACIKAYQRTRPNPPRPGYHYMRRYGITVEDFMDMRRAQDLKCAICHEEKDLVVDHDHETGKVRGLLCGTCNTRLGIYEGWVQMNEEAIRDYLR